MRDADSLQWTYLTPAFETIYGLTRTEALEGDNYRSWLDLILPQDREHAAREIERVRSGEQVVFEYRIERPSDGRVRWLRNTDFPITDGSGRIVWVGGIGHDITELRESGERARLLLAELQHRVRNIMAMIRSVARRTAESTETVQEFAQHLEGRIGAMARTQVMLTRQAGAAVDLEDMIRDELVAQVASEDQIEIEGPDVELSAKAAEVLTLAIHELATNATKYGAFSRAGGRVHIHWDVEERGPQKWLKLNWQETGVPVIDAAPRRRGFGSELISRRIPYELKGRASFRLEPGGLRSHIEFPLMKGDSILQTDGVP